MKLCSIDIYINSLIFVDDICAGHDHAPLQSRQTLSTQTYGQSSEGVETCSFINQPFASMKKKTNYVSTTKFQQRYTKHISIEFSIYPFYHHIYKINNSTWDIAYIHEDPHITVDVYIYIIFIGIYLYIFTLHHTLNRNLHISI